MKRVITLLQINFWSGAILDAFMVPILVSPKLCGLMIGMPNFNPDLITRYIMNVGAALMASWTGVLIWAAMKPIERKGIVWITLLLLQSGLVVSGITLYVQNGISLEKAVPIWSISGYLICLHIASLFASRNIKIPVE
jgi:hypothetical protein